MGAVPGTLQEGGAAFGSTHWSLVQQCAEDGSRDDPGLSRAALETLCRAYWPPLYAFVRRRGHPPAEAQDLVQGFFAHLLETRTYARADPARGKFRSFLLGSLKHFLANAYDHDHALKRGGGQRFVPLDEHLAEAEAAASADADSDLGADGVFEQRWAAAILTHAWTALRAEADAGGRGALLDALRPYVAGGATAPPAQDEVAARLGLPPATVRTHVRRLRERFRAALRAEVARTLPAAGDVDEELRHLRRALGERAVRPP